MLAADQYKADFAGLEKMETNAKRLLTDSVHKPVEDQEDMSKGTSRESSEFIPEDE
jgi:hypothetical protein